MATQIDALTAKLNEAGIKAGAWRNQRIYLNGHGKDIKAFITLDMPESDAAECTGEMGLFSGCALKVFSEANQDAKWLANRAKQVKHRIMESLVECEIIPGPVCENWQDVIL